MASRGGEAFKRLGPGGAISLVAAILLFAFTFFQWYGRPHSGPNTLLIDLWPYGGGTAWQTLGIVPLLVVLAAAVVGVAISALRLTGSGRRSGLPLGALVGLLGLLAAAVIAAAINWPPEVDPIERIPIEQSIEAGPYLALAAALAIACGGWLTWRAEGT
ncbi:MAG: hypothetical protein ACRDPE_02750 [Solirubrobacterales bacterium]